MAVGVIAGCGKKQAPAKTDSAVRLGPESYAVAAEGTIESGPMLTGTLVARKEATVRAQVAGSVVKALVEQGQAVAAGQPIAEIDATAITDAASSAKVAVLNAQTQLDLAKKDAARAKQLKSAGAISESDLEAAHKAVVSAEAALSAAGAQSASAKKQVGNTIIRAPFAGVVSAKSVSIGDVVQSGTALYTIIDPSTLELQATVAANALGLVHLGAAVSFKITGYPDQIFKGTITRINPAADPTTRQVLIYASIPNEGHKLVAGLYVEGRVASATQEGIILPFTAIDRRMVTPAVDLVKDGVVARQVISLGTIDEATNNVLIASGLQAGDTVLNGSAIEIALGSKIIFIADSTRHDTTAATARP